MADAAVFTWEGTDRQGRKTKGEISSASQQVARAELRRQGINPSKVQKKTTSRFQMGGGKVKSADISLFTRQMATMMKAGVPLVQSFDIVADGADNAKLKTLIRAWFPAHRIAHRNRPGCRTDRRNTSDAF